MAEQLRQELRRDHSYSHDSCHGSSFAARAPAGKRAISAFQRRGTQRCLSNRSFQRRSAAGTGSGNRSEEVKYSSTIRNGLIAMLLAIGAAISGLAQAAPKLQPGDTIANQKPSILDQVGLDQRLNQQIPLDLTFNDE